MELVCKNKILDVYDIFDNISKSVYQDTLGFTVFHRSKASTVSEWLNLNGYTTSLSWEPESLSKRMAQLPSIYIRRQNVRSQRSLSPRKQPALWPDVPEAAATDPAMHDEWLNTKSQGSSHIPYLTLALDTDALCQFSCVGTGGWLQTLWHTSDFPMELQSQQPLSMNREPSVPRYPPQIIVSRRCCTLSSIHLHPPFPSTNQPPDTHQSHSPGEGSMSYDKSSNYVSAYRSRFQCVLAL